MKSLLHIFVLFVFSFPVVGHAQKGKGKGKNNKYDSRKLFERSSLAPKETLTERDGQKQGLFPNSRGRGSKTLQEAQNQLNNREGQERNFPKSKQVLPFVQSLESAFTVSDIQKHLPRCFCEYNSQGCKRVNPFG